MDTTPPEDDLLVRARAGDARACEQLLTVHRDRLRRMVAVRLDRRMAARVDPSDVVQEALADACGLLPGYLKEQPLPFYPWLRQLAWNRLVELYRKHVLAQRRSVTREETPRLPEESVLELAERLVAAGSTPSRRLARDELRARVRQALLELSERDREVLVLRYLEQLPVAEIAAVLGISEGAVKVRNVRALQRLRAVLGAGEDQVP
jgi:RNA polymerase sigma-70 factor (ECF subfamily)